jgi:hypothetical protein
VSGGGAGRVTRDARGRRVREEDRYGGPVARLAWSDDGRLAEAAVRLPDGRWLRIEPRAAADPRWGASDRLVLDDGRALTYCAAVDWAAIDGIPALAEPARLPPGAGTAVLNLIASLAADHGRRALTYRGPYPTESLFLALLESFAWRPGEAGPDPDDPLARFLAGGLTWTPAPHARAWTPEGVFVQSRGRVEKVVWRGRAYYRADWQGVRRAGAHRVHDAGGGYRCSLWALERELQTHLTLAADGTVLAATEPALDSGPARPLPPPVAAGLVAIVAAGSAPPLAASLRAVAAELAFEWAPLAGDLGAIDAGRAKLSPRLQGALAERLAGALMRAEQVRLGFAALAEAAGALGDSLRLLAQARLAAAPPAAQAAALETTRSPADAAAAAREIGLAVERLLEDAVSWRERPA